MLVIRSSTPLCMYLSAHDLRPSTPRSQPRLAPLHLPRLPVAQPPTHPHVLVSALFRSFRRSRVSHRSLPAGSDSGGASTVSSGAAGSGSVSHSNLSPRPLTSHRIRSPEPCKSLTDPPVRPLTLLPPCILTLVISFSVAQTLYSCKGNPNPTIRPSSPGICSTVFARGVCSGVDRYLAMTEITEDPDWWPRVFEGGSNNKRCIIVGLIRAAAPGLVLFFCLLRPSIFRSYFYWIRFRRPPLPPSTCRCMTAPPPSPSRSRTSSSRHLRACRTRTWCCPVDGQGPAWSSFSTPPPPSLDAEVVGGGIGGGLFPRQRSGTEQRKGDDQRRTHQRLCLMGRHCPLRRCISTRLQLPFQPRPPPRRRPSPGLGSCRTQPRTVHSGATSTSGHLTASRAIPCAHHFEVAQTRMRMPDPERDPHPQIGRVRHHSSHSLAHTRSYRPRSFLRERRSAYPPKVHDFS